MAVFLSAICATAAPDSALQPDADFLEFLGSWTTEHTRPRWVDPFRIQDLPNEETVDPAKRSRQEPKDRVKTPPLGNPSIQPQSAPDSNRAGEEVKP